MTNTNLRLLFVSNTFAQKKKCSVKGVQRVRSAEIIFRGELRPNCRKKQYSFVQFGLKMNIWFNSPFNGNNATFYIKTASEI